MTRKRSFTIIGLVTSLSLVTSACGSLEAPHMQASPSASSTAIENPVTDVRHLDFMMAPVNLNAIAGHTTYNLPGEAQGMGMWYDSERKPDGSYTNRGAGQFVDNKWEQGAYRLDDISAASVAAMRYWQTFKNEDSRHRAKELLRTAMYMQNTEGPQAGLAVRWMQQDGSLNNANGEAAVDLLQSGAINPSDSAVSSWFGQYVWALGEGYNAFKDSDPPMAKYIQERIKLSEEVINKAIAAEKAKPQQTLNGEKVTQDLPSPDVEVSSNIVLGLSSYLNGVGSDSSTEKLLKTLTDAMATTALGEPGIWPYGAMMSSTHSPSYWAASQSGAGAALAKAAPALKRSDVMTPALLDESLWSVNLLTNQGVSSTIDPLVSNNTQTPEGVDLRLRSMIDIGKQSEADGILGMSAMVAGWYFGANNASKPMFDSNTGAFYTKLNPDKTIDQNSSAEATIHGVLSMISLDQNPDIKNAAKTYNLAPSVEGPKFFDASTLKLETLGALETPATAWTGDSTISGGKVAAFQDGATYSLDIGANILPRTVTPITQITETTTGSTAWSANDASLGSAKNSFTDNKASAWSAGTVFPESLSSLTPKGQVTLKAKVSGTARLNGVLVQPQVSKADFGQDQNRRIMYFNSAKDVLKYPVELPSAGKWINKIYDSKGYYVSQEILDSTQKPQVTIAPTGFSLIQPASPEDLSPTPTAS